MSRETIIKTSWNDASETEANYTRLCVSALLTFLFGLSAFLVHFSLWFFFLGVVAIILGLCALWSIRNSEGTLTGASLAYVGVCCGLIALVSVAVFWSSYQYGIRREADQFFRLWFDAALQGDVPRTKELLAIYSHRSRAASAEEWWQTQYDNRFAHHAIHQHVENKLIRVLMALGKEANVSYYKTLNVVSERDSDTVVSVYAVTFPAASGVTETFFVNIIGKRIYPQDLPDFKAAGWRLASTPTFYFPEEFKKN